MIEAAAIMAVAFNGLSCCCPMIMTYNSMSTSDSSLIEMIILIDAGAYVFQA